MVNFVNLEFKYYQIPNKSLPRRPAGKIQNLKLELFGFAPNEVTPLEFHRDPDEQFQRVVRFGRNWDLFSSIGPFDFTQDQS